MLCYVMLYYIILLYCIILLSLSSLLLLLLLLSVQKPKECRSIYSQNATQIEYTRKLNGCFWRVKDRQH